MYKIIPLLVITCLTLTGQTAEVVQPDITKGWRIHTGDNTDWAAPRFDDSKWKPN